MANALRLTTTGRALIADGANTGLSAVRLTHLAVGSGHAAGGAGNDARAALRNERNRAAVSGAADAAGQVAYRADFAPTETYSVTEAGIFGRVGSSGAVTLLAYWTDGGTALAAAVPGAALTIAGVLEVQAAAADVTVTVSTALTLGDPALAARVASAEAAVGRLDGEQDTQDGLIAALGRRMTTAETGIAQNAAKDLTQDGLLAGLRRDADALRTDLTALQAKAITAATVGRYIDVEDVMAVKWRHQSTPTISVVVGAVRGVTASRAAGTVAFAAGTYWIEGDARATTRGEISGVRIVPIAAAAQPALESAISGRREANQAYAYRGVVEVVGAGSRVCRIEKFATDAEVTGTIFIRRAGGA